MAQAKHGDTVNLHYTGTLDDGRVIDTSVGTEPLQFTLGENRFIADFEQAVVGMNPGESKNIRIPADKVFGQYREEMVVVVNQKEFPENIKPCVGLQLDVIQGDGQKFPVTVIDVSNESVTLDANHPLAGKDLIVDIQLIEIV
jgi:peptidylprolyl isomerase